VSEVKDENYEQLVKVSYFPTTSLVHMQIMCRVFFARAEYELLS